MDLTRSPVIWISYTTLYRDGGPMLARAAETLAATHRAHGDTVVIEAVESKREVVDAFARITAAGQAIAALHFFGHAGMYGPMFRTTAMPEQFSPHEWRRLAADGAIPFAPQAKAYFHACRSGRWFAPFFARTFGVPTHGYRWYTTFSASADRFRWLAPHRTRAPVHLIGCPGRKSHGLLSSLAKYTGRAAAEEMRRYEPTPIGGDSSYDEVAALYDAVFDDIRVRADEWRWISEHLEAAGDQPRVLDIGCGNGALLTQLAPRITSGHGVDPSASMLNHARRRAQALPNLKFSQVHGPTLPVPDGSVDVVISMLSFRYLDWDPLMQEIMRVLAPGGRLLIVDMVTAPVKRHEWPRFVRAKAHALTQRATHTRYRQALAKLVGDPRWQTMLRYNPIRAEHEMRWFLESRFPDRKVELLNVGWHNRVLAFDSGPIAAGTWIAPQSYP